MSGTTHSSSTTPYSLWSVTMTMHSLSLTHWVSSSFCVICHCFFFFFLFFFFFFLLFLLNKSISIDYVSICNGVRWRHSSVNESLTHSLTHWINKRVIRTCTSSSVASPHHQSHPIVLQQLTLNILTVPLSLRFLPLRFLLVSSLLFSTLRWSSRITLTLPNQEYSKCEWWRLLFWDGKQNLE